MSFLSLCLNTSHIYIGYSRYVKFTALYIIYISYVVASDAILTLHNLFLLKTHYRCFLTTNFHILSSKLLMLLPNFDNHQFEISYKQLRQGFTHKRSVRRSRNRRFLRNDTQSNPKIMSNSLNLKFLPLNDNTEILFPSVIDQRHECKVPQDKCFLFLLYSRAGTIYHTWRQTQSNEENRADHSHATGLYIIHARETFITPQMTPYCGSCKIALLSGRNITAS